jgi:hypothetical protein
MPDTVPQIPVTVLTGYLGSGKTTLLNRILSETHGKRFAVIVNEFGEVGIDNDLIVDADEEIFEMNNGCICCTVRGDLIRIIAGLMRRSRAFDGIVIETTGLADPAPVAQTFFVDDDVRRKTKLDARSRQQGRSCRCGRPRYSRTPYPKHQSICENSQNGALWYRSRQVLGRELISGAFSTSSRGFSRKNTSTNTTTGSAACPWLPIDR